MITPVLTCHSREPRAFETYYRYWALVNSLRRLGCAPTTLAYNDSSFAGLMSKPFFFCNWLKTNRPTGHVILCDAWDVIFTEHPDSLVERCKSLHGDAVVFNAERSCWPRADLAEHFPDTGTPWRYLNSGFICGPSERVLAMLEALDIESIGFDRPDGKGGRFEPNDQGYFQELFLKQPVPMALDGKCEIAQSFSGCDMNDFEITAQGVLNKVTGTRPGVAHFNGGSKNNVPQEIIQHFCV